MNIDFEVSIKANVRKTMPSEGRYVLILRGSGACFCVKRHIHGSVGGYVYFAQEMTRYRSHGI